MMQHNNVRMARLVYIILEALLIFSSPAREETSGFNEEFPRIIRSSSSSFESGLGGAIRAGLFNIAGEFFAIGESLGLNDDAIDGCIDGGCEGLTEG